MRRFTRLTVAFILMLTAAIGCEEGQPENGSLQSVDIEEVLTITSENVNRSDPDLVFGIPYNTVTDDSGFIYTFDRSQNTIFKFDDAGNFIHTIGGEGQGPGELQSVYAMAVTTGNQLFVYDYMSSRSTIFGDDGDVDQILSMEFRHALDTIRPASNGHMLLPHVQDNHIIHYYDMPRQEITESLVSVDEILSYDEEYELNMLTAMPGSAIALSEDLIAYTPEYYSGSLYIYSRNGDTWRLDREVSGYRDIEKPFTIHETTSEPPEGANTISTHPEGSGYLGFELHSRSLGLYTLNDGEFAHMSYLDTDEETNESIFVVEVFDAGSQELKKAATIDELTVRGQPQQMPVWLDRSGSLYVVKNPSNPTLARLDINW